MTGMLKRRDDGDVEMLRRTYCYVVSSHCVCVDENIRIGGAEYKEIMIFALSNINRRLSSELLFFTVGANSHFQREMANRLYRNKKRQTIALCDLMHLDAGLLRCVLRPGNTF